MRKLNLSLLYNLLATCIIFAICHIVKPFYKLNFKLKWLRKM